MFVVLVGGVLGNGLVIGGVAVVRHAGQVKRKSTSTPSTFQKFSSAAESINLRRAVEPAKTGFLPDSTIRRGGGL